MNKKLCISLIILFFISNCSIFNKVIYSSNINQGNFLTKSNIDKIHIGMTKQQIIYILGNPTIKDIFNSNVWFYIARCENNHQLISQQTLSLTFNKKNILTYIFKR